MRGVGDTLSAKGKHRSENMTSISCAFQTKCCFWNWWIRFLSEMIINVFETVQIKTAHLFHESDTSVKYGWFIKTLHESNQAPKAFHTSAVYINIRYFLQLKHWTYFRFVDFPVINQRPLWPPQPLLFIIWQKLSYNVTVYWLCNT